MTPQLVRVLRDAYLEAGRRYADDSVGGSEHGALVSGSLMRIAAKRMRAAERELESMKAAPSFGCGVEGPASAGGGAGSRNGCGVEDEGEEA